MPPRLLLTGALILIVLITGLLWPASPQTPAADAAPGDFALPWEPGRRLYTLQGQNQGSHTGASQQYAYDFNLAPFDGRPFVVVASRAGTVQAVRQSSHESPNCDLALYSLSNYVLLDHGDGTGSNYSHLLKDSVPVAVGQKVIQGQPIGKSDHSGYICGTGHLHFTVVDIKTMAGLDRPFADRDALRDGGRPKTDQWYAADAAQRGAQGMIPRVFLPYLTKGKGR